MKMTARSIAEFLAEHMVARDMAAILPGQFDQEAVWDVADDQGRQLIKVFEDKRRMLLEARGTQYPELLDAI
ncbi:hypothetical protein [Candidatus Sororendozoicomonas aggregata]|uniref:hypothetical protein n=1 Tax=Candidatus Sororendozoicomonas aggregata TaxID=3073239 RepID=UPI002ED4C321